MCFFVKATQDKLAVAYRSLCKKIKRNTNNLICFSAELAQAEIGDPTSLRRKRKPRWDIKRLICSPAELTQGKFTVVYRFQHK